MYLVYGMMQQSLNFENFVYCIKQTGFQIYSAFYCFFALNAILLYYSQVLIVPKISILCLLEVVFEICNTYFYLKIRICLFSLHVQVLF